MNDFQFWMMFASVFATLSGGIGWIVAWNKTLASRISKLEIEIAVLKAISEERAR